MLPEDAFLRRLPVALNADQRFRFEALVFAADQMEVALARLTAVTTEAALEIGSATDEQRATLFSDCWTIVDQVHVVREILRGPHFRDRLGERTAAWVAAYEAATLLRNCMDHLRVRISGLAKAKGRSQPLFGALSYFLIPPEKFLQADGGWQITGGNVVTICAGSSTGEQLVEFINPAGRTDLKSPVCLFRLEAFDQRLELERAVLEFRPILADMSSTVEVSLFSQLSAEAEKRGVAVDEVMSPATLNTVFIIAIEFGSPDLADAPASPSS